MAEPTNDVAAENAELPATREKLNELTQAASLQYSLKNFSAAADHYADAAEIQSKLNGEMAPENAELLFNYGRALYKVAIAKSDVLGTKVVQEEKKAPKKKRKAKKPAEDGKEKEVDIVTQAKQVRKEEQREREERGIQPPKSQLPTLKPYFQLMDDWEDSEDEEDDENQEGEEEEQDDFADAFQMFDLARVLYHKQVETLEVIDDTDKGKGKKELKPEVRLIKEKLADIYGFLTDLSFENERFHDAIPDARTSLALLEELYPSSHEKIVSAHYTLSLALEFASVSKIREQQANQDTAADPLQESEDTPLDWDLRNEAIKHTYLAIENQEAHLKKAEEALSSETFTPEKRKELDAELADKKGMLEDLKTRLVDLKEDPTKQKVEQVDSTVFNGMLAGLLKAPLEEQKRKLAEATKTANDLSGLVKPKKKKNTPAATSDDKSSGKRKLEVVEEDNANGKRAKTEEKE